MKRSTLYMLLAIALMLFIATRSNAATPDYSEDQAALREYAHDPKFPAIRACIALDVYVKSVTASMVVVVGSSGTVAAYDATADFDQLVPFMGERDASWATTSLVPHLLLMRETGQPLGAEYRRSIYLSCLSSKGVK